MPTISVMSTKWSGMACSQFATRAAFRLSALCHHQTPALVTHCPPRPPSAVLATEDGEDGSAATVIVPPEEVRKRFKRIKPLKEISVAQRGESKTPKAPARDVYRSSGLDVLNIVRRISEGRATRVSNISGKSLPHIGY
jgi:hypothetical protein